MSPESPSIGARIRAGVAATLAWLGGAAHRLEDWSSRGSRSLVLGLVVVGALLLCTVAIFSVGRASAGWGHGGPRGGPYAAQVHRAGPPDRPFSKPFGKPDARSDRRHERPRPPAPPEAPVPPPPPVAP
jgi:hypothetical protein